MVSNASGRPPDGPWGRFKAIFANFRSKRGRQNLPENFPYISLLKAPLFGVTAGVIYAHALELVRVTVASPTSCRLHHHKHSAFSIGIP